MLSIQQEHEVLERFLLLQGQDLLLRPLSIINFHHLFQSLLLFRFHSLLISLISLILFLLLRFLLFHLRLLVQQSLGSVLQHLAMHARLDAALQLLRPGQCLDRFRLGQLVV